MRKIFLVILVFLANSSCYSQRSVDEILSRKQKVIQIESHKSLYVLTTINSQDYTDTMKIVTLKDSVFKKYKLKSKINQNNSKQIVVGDTYSFKLRSNMRFNIDPQTHARYVISEKDTLWREGDQKNKVPSYSSNTKGLLIKED